ncbi:hypothetical protein NPD8_4062 (plasmid) [Clostridium botulinum]|uniref:Uncharacterized protein n=1 Tax=Clostridium botulinum TaxID=1491 RepID=A0A1L7JNW9_CLOBO|nr:hypothetical protein NPD8_4062 [Clostridium botulinum]
MDIRFYIKNRENTIKNIKFEGEDNMEFNWNEFKYNYMAIHCSTEEKLKDFKKECRKRNYTFHIYGEFLEL